MAAELFTSETAKALKETLEECCAWWARRRPRGRGTIDEALDRSIATTWMQFMTAGSVTAQWREGAWEGVWEIVCECGSGSNAIGPGHSDWCGCYRRG